MGDRHLVEFYGHMVPNCAIHGPTARKLDSQGICDVCSRSRIDHTRRTVSLVNGAEWEAISDQIKANVFGEMVKLVFPTRTNALGEMVKLASPVLGEYHSDLYRDALWIHENLQPDSVLFYAVRPSGTHLYHIDDDAIDSVRDLAWKSTYKYVDYELSLTDNGRSKWELTIQPKTILESEGIGNG